MDIRRAQNVREMHDVMRLRKALTAALAAAAEARAPERVVALLRGAYATLESARFVDDDAIKWAEASLGAWRRWAAGRRSAGRGLLVVAVDDELVRAVEAIAADAALGAVRLAQSPRAALEALAVATPDAILFDHDGGPLAPSTEMLEWLATDLPLVIRLGYVRDPSTIATRERALYHAVLAKPPAASTLLAAIARREPSSSTG